MAETILETPRLILRRFRDTDLELWTEHLNTPEVRAHLGGVDLPERCAERFTRQKASWNDQEGGWLVIERREDRAFLGNCGFGPVTADEAPEPLRGSIEIGWSLRADGWGRGYATEAASAMLAMIFGRFDHAFVYSQTSQPNRGSWRVMERLGMERWAELDYHDPVYPPEENPTMVYGLSRADWARSKEAAARG